MGTHQRPQCRLRGCRCRPSDPADGQFRVPLQPDISGAEMATALAGAGTGPNARAQCRAFREFLCPVDVPLSLREPAHGACAQLRHYRCHRPLDAPKGQAGVASHGLGCLWTSSRKCRHRAGCGSSRLDRPQHRPDARATAAFGLIDRLVARSGDLPQRLLPLDPVAVFAISQRRSGVPQRSHRQLGPD